jgi:non-ribosomal peptide synthetase component F
MVDVREADDRSAVVAAAVRAAWADIVVGGGPAQEDLAFLEVGGHSLAAARLIARLRADLGVEVSMALVVRDDPTLAQLVDVVIGLAAAGGENGRPRAEAAVVADAVPVTAPVGPTLRRIWTWHRLYPESPAYNVVRVLAVEDRLQPAALRAALADVSARHEALRCAVAEPLPGRPEIVVHERVTVPLSVEVVRADDDAVIDAALYRVGERPFPMATAPLWRVGVVYVPARQRSFLVLVLHHLISDLRSTDLLFGEIAAAYGARAAGTAPEFGDAAPGLLAHLGHEARLAGTAKWQADLDWWTERLAEAGASAPLPLTVLDRDDQAHAAMTHSVALPAAESEALDAALRTRRLTPALFFLTAASAVLAAWSGPGRMEVVGLPSVRVSRPEDQRLVGFLLDTLLLPVSPDSEAAFLRAYEALRDAYVDAAEHALPPFDEVVERLRLPRTARSPLIRLWFSDMTQAAPPTMFGDAAAVEHDLPPAWALFDLGLYLRRSADGYRLHLVVPQGQSEPADMAAMLGQILRTVTRAAADPERLVGELIEPAEEPQVAAQGVTPSASVLLRRHAGRQPDAIALSDAIGDLDYRALDQLVEQEAVRLTATAGPGAIVALPARRDREFVVRLLACRRAGVVVVLVDAQWPQWRRARAYEVAGVAWAYPWAGAGAVAAVDTGGVAEPGGGEAGHVLFTSGTTGDPLAVRSSASVTEAALADLGELLDIGVGDRVSMLSGPAHDPVFRDVELALRAGATVCVPPADVLGRPGRIAAWLRAARVSVVSGTPALLGLVFGADQESMPDLRLVVCGGSPLSRRTAASIRSSAPGAVLVNGYGCTETPQLVVANMIGPADPLPPNAEVPIGAPLRGRRIEVRTAGGRRCDVGQLGEISVGAPHIAEGYLGDGAPDRFDLWPDGTRRFRTDDLARRDAAGRLHLAGRADRQVLVNGYRIMLEELETVARGHAGVADAVAQVVGDGDRQAVRIWVQPGPDASVAEDELRAHLAAVLPAAAVPSRVIVVDELDLAETLKPRPPALAPPAESAPSAGDPGHAVDVRVRQLAESMLGRPLDPVLNFFDAGFTSASLVQMSAELSDALGCPVGALSVFRHPNLRALSTFLVGTPDALGDRPDQPVSAADRSDRLARILASTTAVRGREAIDGGR